MKIGFQIPSILKPHTTNTDQCNANLFVFWRRLDFMSIDLDFGRTDQKPAFLLEPMRANGRLQQTNHMIGTWTLST